MHPLATVMSAVLVENYVKRRLTECHFPEAFVHNMHGITTARLHSGGYTKCATVVVCCCCC